MFRHTEAHSYTELDLKVVPGNVYQYFRRACQRELTALAGQAGETMTDERGSAIVFYAETASGKIASLQYKATTATTLLGLAEHLAELLVGKKLKEALEFPSETLLRLHPELDEDDRHLADLVVQAMQSAVSRLPAE